MKLIGASIAAIKKAEDRDLFKQAMMKIGLEVPTSAVAHSEAEAEAVRRQIGLPVIIRPSRTLGGTGGSIARSLDDFRAKVLWGLDCSPSHEILIEQSVEGWKEFELEVMRDGADNVVIVCSIENLDPMGVHTGDSITVAPAQTLTDKEYQLMRDASLRIIREIGVDTGGSNIQFAVDPQDRPDGGNRDEPAGVAQFGAGLQGHRISDRQDRRAAGGRLSARRNRQRHHASDPGLLRADDRLRRHQDSALHLREISRRGGRIGTADEVGRRGDGDWADLRGIAAQGAALAGNRTPRVSRAASPGRNRESAMEEIRRPAGDRQQPADLLPGRWIAAGNAYRAIAKLTGIDPWFIDGIAKIVRAEERLRSVALDAATLREVKALGFADSASRS